MPSGAKSKYQEQWRAYRLSPSEYSGALKSHFDQAEQYRWDREGCIYRACNPAYEALVRYVDKRYPHVWGQWPHIGRFTRYMEAQNRESQ